MLVALIVKVRYKDFFFKCNLFGPKYNRQWANRNQILLMKFLFISILILFGILKAIYKVTKSWKWVMSWLLRGGSSKRKCNKQWKKPLPGKDPLLTQIYPSGRVKTGGRFRKRISRAEQLSTYTGEKQCKKKKK